MATGVGASQIAPSDESAWSAYAVGNDENRTSFDENPSTSPKISGQPRARKSNGQLRNGDLNAVNRTNSTDRFYDGSGPSAKASRDRLRTAPADRPRVKRKTSKGIVALLEDDIPEDEHSKWIHRDKLAAIESRELAEMGLRVRHSRSTSRARSTRTGKASIDAADTSGEPLPDFGDDPRLSRTDKRLRTKSPMPGDDEDAGDEAMVAEDFAEAVSQRDDNPRPTTSSGLSRLPVSRNTNPYENQSPSDSPEHARSGSREIQMQKQRLRSQSGTLLPEESPVQRDASGKKLPPSAARKASVASGANNRKYSSNSDSSSPVRPSTSGRSRPSTRNGVPSNPVNRPEGDPPWMNSMYKPDPRLPPDQQMLPTHARRMAELQRDAAERGEPNPASGESEFVLLDSEGSGSDQASGTKRQSHIKTSSVASPNLSQQSPRPTGQGSPRKSQAVDRDSGQWPLRTPTPTRQLEMQAQDARLDPAHQRTITTDSTNGHGGYNIMPAIQTQLEQEKAVEMHQARLSVAGRPSHQGHGRHLSAEQWQQNASQAPVHQPVSLTPQMGEKKKEKKEDGCLSCCVVM